jgi:fucose 4-O-acetylase-like acetyltransferase
MQRDFLLDNLKFITITLVVFGHLIEPFIKTDEIIKGIYMSIYSVHMPLFALLAGIFAKDLLTQEYILKIIKNLLIPFIIFTFLYEMYEFFMMGAISHYTLGLKPYWILWFLFSLIIWKLSLPIILKFKHPILLSIIIAIVLGYINKVGYFLGISRTIYFFPFFIIGYQMASMGLLKYNFKNTFYPVFIFIILFNIVIFYNLNSIPYQLLWGSYSYHRLGLFDDYAPLVRLGVYLISIITVFSILFLIPSKEYKFTKFGQNSLYVYLWHGFFVKLLIFYGILKYIAGFNTIITLSAFFIISVSISIFLSTNKVSKFSKKYLFNPFSKLALKEKIKFDR